MALLKVEQELIQSFSVKNVRNFCSFLLNSINKLSYSKIIKWGYTLG